MAGLLRDNDSVLGALRALQERVMIRDGSGHPYRPVGMEARYLMESAVDGHRVWIGQYDLNDLLAQQDAISDATIRSARERGEQ